VAALSVELAAELGWSPARRALLRDAALIHDVGKIGVPDAILLKPARLTPAERAVVNEHAALGAQIAAEVLGPEQAVWIRHHHERVDGRGYPDGLAGDEIADGARLIALADSWDVMTSARPYSAALSIEAALVECRRCADTQFAPEAVAALERLAAAGALDRDDDGRELRPAA
jgi:HD-GYP domain-containing protein (c-di-GMP phosphodiesterase class II)